MNVLLVNGSPHPLGRTCTALSEIAKTLKAEGLGVTHLMTGTLNTTTTMSIR